MITGQLTDVGGTSPLRLSFTVNGANRDFQSNDVARIVLARPNDVTGTVHHRRPAVAPAPTASRCRRGSDGRQPA